MKTDITLEMLARLNAELDQPYPPKVEVQTPHAEPSQLMKNLLGNSPSESPAEIVKLKSALTLLPSSVGRGNGSFYDAAGQPVANYWQAAVWAIAGLGWACGEDIARDWSKQCPGKYTDAGFEKAWGDYKPTHPNPVGIGSLYKRAMELGWQSQQVTVLPNTHRYKLLESEDIRKLPDLDWRIKGIFPSKGLGAIYGPSGSGKSFLVLDMAAAVAGGKRWFGNKTKPTTVVYVSLEGEAALKNRIAVWERKWNMSIPKNLKVVIQSFKLNQWEDVKDLASVIPSGGVIIIDTLNRAAPTADENSSKEMGEILEAAKELHTATDGLVLVVHHTGKDTSKGARGHSSLFAALDGAIEVTRNLAGRAWSIAKSKDGEDGKTTPFKLVVCELGKDADGEAITSCIVESDQSQIFQKPNPTGAKQKAAYVQVKTALTQSTVTGKAGCGSMACIKVDEAVCAIAVNLTTVQQNKRSNRARTILESLILGGFLATALEGGDGWVWLP